MYTRAKWKHSRGLETEVKTKQTRKKKGKKQQVKNSLPLFHLTFPIELRYKVLGNLKRRGSGDGEAYSTSLLPKSVKQLPVSYQGKLWNSLLRRAEDRL